MITKGEFKGWDAWFIKKGLLELVLVPQIGGRIMGLFWRGHDLFFTQAEREGKTEDLGAAQDIKTKKKEMGFPLWGGNKTWLSPQEKWNDGTPFFDLDSGPYRLTVEKESPELLEVHMTSRICRETGIQITRKISLSEKRPGWMVSHHIHNHSEKPVEWGIWDVSMLLKPGKVYLPRNPKSQFPSGLKTFTEEGDSEKARLKVFEEMGSLARIDCTEPTAFKFGSDSDEGWMLGIVEGPSMGLVGFKKEVDVAPHQNYGHACVAEVYNSNRYPYFEMETHGPVTRLKPGESFGLQETYTLMDVPYWPKTEKDVRWLLEREKSPI